MHIEVIAIGNEILSGVTVNTNATFISQELFKAGFGVHRHLVLADDEVELKAGLKESIERSSLVITTGGLGPTCDDVTRQFVAELAESKFVFSEEVALDLRRRYGNRLISLEDQATVPEKAQVLLNTVGTAPTLILKVKKALLIVMPGVPNEMEPMMRDQVIPFLLRTFPVKQRIYREVFSLVHLPESAVDPLLRQLVIKDPELKVGIYPSQGTLMVHLGIAAPSEAAAKCRLANPREELTKAFGANMFNSKHGLIEEAVHERLLAMGKTLCIAESCTGGALQARIVSQAGASEYFLGGVVAYSDALKERILGVPKSVLQTKGAVSGEVVGEMVKGVLAITGADYGVAVSGIAGPAGGTPEKPVGTVWGAVGKKDGEIKTFQFPAGSSRKAIIARSVTRLLGELFFFLKN